MPAADETRMLELARAWALREATTLQNPHATVRLDESGEVLIVVEGTEQDGTRSVAVGKGQLAALQVADSEATREWATLIWFNPREGEVIGDAMRRLVDP